MTNKAGPKGYTRKKPTKKPTKDSTKIDKYEVGKHALGVIGGAIGLGVMMNSTHKPDIIKPPNLGGHGYQGPYGRGSPIPRKKKGLFSW